MKKIFSTILAGVFVMSTLVGCGGNTQEQTNTKVDSGAGVVTIYSPHPADPLNAGVKEFQEKTGITVNIVAAGTGELLKRIEAEATNPMCDVFWGAGAESLVAYSDYFESYTPAEDAIVDPINKDAEHKWIGESPVPMVIMYNKKLVSESDVPKGWGDLIDSKWRGKIAYADPAKSGSSFTILATMVTAFGKEDGKGWEFIKQFVDNLDGKILGGSSAVYKGVADGEYSVGLTLEKTAQEYVKAGAEVGFVYPQEGTSAVPDGVAIIKGSQNQENAKKFVDFVLAKENQTMMSEEYNRRPARTDLEPPAGLAPMSDIKFVDYDFKWAAESKSQILNQWKDIVIGK